MSVSLMCGMPFGDGRPRIGRGVLGLDGGLFMNRFHIRG